MRRETERAASAASEGTAPGGSVTKGIGGVTSRIAAGAWGWRILLVLSGMLWLSLVAATWADAKEDDEYNFNWLDPEKKIYVLQNRRYQKAQHLLASVTVGPGFSNPYRTSYNFDPRLAYYFTENWGLEGFYTVTVNQENSTFAALEKAAPNTLPVVREIRGQYGALLHWAPWYAKINVFNKILYFDWYFTGGAGQIHSALDTRTNANASPSYVSQDLFSLFVGTGQIYHVTDSFDVRFDLTGAFYNAPIFGTSGDNSWYSNWNFGIGVGLKI